MLLLLLAVRAARLVRRPPTGPRPEDALAVTPRAFAWVASTFAAVWLLGFSPGVPLAMLAYLRIAGRERWGLAIVYAAGLHVAVAGIFEGTLGIPLPHGLALNALYGVE